jgi:hypothetical protein
MLARLGDWWRKLCGAPLGERLYWAGLALTLLLGVFLRVNGYAGQQISLWLDEALWAPRFVNQPLLTLGIRPIGFVWLTRLLVHTFGATEIWLRFLPNVAALLSLLLMPYIAGRLLKRRALQLLLVLLFAIHPALVDFANEFKPYSFEVFIHLIPIVLYLRYEQTRRNSYWYGLLAFLPVSFLLAYNMAFAFPGLLLLGLRAARLGDQRRKLLVATVLSGVLCAGTAGVTYKLALSKVTKEERTENYWGKKYDVFYRAQPGESRLDWTLGRYADFAAMIGLRRHLWHEPGRLPERAATELGAADRWLWIGLGVAGLVALHRRRREQLLLLAAPLVVMTLVNLLGKWPLGAFRTNLFMAVYLFPLPLIGLELIDEWSRNAGRGLLAAVAVTCVLPGFAFGFDLHGHKRTWTRDHYQREVIERLYALRSQQLAKDPKLPRARLVLDLHTYQSHEYYLKTHPVFREKYAAFFRKNFAQDNVGSDRLVSKAQQRLRSKDPVWVVASKASSTEAMDDFAENRTRVLIRERIGDQHLILLLDKD